MSFSYSGLGGDSPAMWALRAQAGSRGELVFPVLDVVVGMAFVYSLLSLIASAIREAGENVINQRAAVLREGLDRLLGPEVAQDLLAHPVVGSLGPKPTHIPPRAFSAALLDILRERGEVPARLQQAMRALEAAAGEARQMPRAIEDWFESAMNSLTGVYRRHTHAWLAAVGLAVTIFTNADTARMVAALFAR